MAFVYKSEAGAYRSPYRSPLAKADFGRQRDVFKLAQRGVGDCKRLWNDFAAEAPEMARLVVADVESEREDLAEVVKGLDKRLAKAEKSAGKPGKAIKGRKRASAGERDVLQAANEVLRAAERESTDPWIRETLRRMAGAPRG